MKYLFLLLATITTMFASAISLDQQNISVPLKNNSVNLLRFPFVVQKADLTTETPESFSVSAKNYTVVITPTAEFPNEEQGDLLIWSAEGDPYLIKLLTNGETGQVFSMTSAKVQPMQDIRAAVFETGRIESDVKKLLKKLVLGEKIQGYKENKVQRLFSTPDLLLQKDSFFDGGKYRAEQWFIQNTTESTLFLEYENFYALGMLLLAFEKRTLEPGQITRAWIIVNKHTLLNEEAK